MPERIAAYLCRRVVPHDLHCGEFGSFPQLDQRLPLATQFLPSTSRRVAVGQNRQCVIFTDHRDDLLEAVLRDQCFGTASLIRAQAELGQQVGDVCSALLLRKERDDVNAWLHGDLDAEENRQAAAAGSIFHLVDPVRRVVIAIACIPAERASSTMSSGVTPSSAKQAEAGV
jgi:hypothetical protein